MYFNKWHLRIKKKNLEWLKFKSHLLVLWLVKLINSSKSDNILYDDFGGGGGGGSGGDDDEDDKRKYNLFVSVSFPQYPIG